MAGCGPPFSFGGIIFGLADHQPADAALKTAS